MSEGVAVKVQAQMGCRLGCHRRSTLSNELASESSSSDSEESVESQVASPITATGTVPEPVVYNFGNNTFWLDEQPTPSELSWHSSDIRVYVVWVIPGHSEPRALAGLHWGAGLSAYSALLSLNGRNHLGGLRWKRVYTLAEGQSLFASEAGRHAVDPVPVRVYRWRHSSDRLPTST